MSCVVPNDEYQSSMLPDHLDFTVTLFGLDADCLAAFCVNKGK